MSLLICALVLIVGVAGASLSEIEFVVTRARPNFVGLTAYFFHAQDIVWLIAMAVLFLGLAVLPLPVMRFPAIEIAPRKATLISLGIALCVFACGIVGIYLVFEGYHLSRDEFLAAFDAMIFRAGKIIAPIDDEWRGFADALAPRFMLPIAQDAGFASGYLPINAGFRALMGIFVDPNWTSPLLAACAIPAVFGVARRLWPARPDAELVSAILTATSSQVLVTSMTSYAMTAHLALDMVWLWCFLRGGKLGHCGAIATGFLATGLHQPIFHPLFALPFIVRLWLSKNRSLGWIYIGAYAAICCFWLSYWQLILTWHGLSPQVAEDAGPVWFAARILVFLTDFQWAGADLMVKNILRFAAWQTPALLPLVVLAAPAIYRDRGISRELLSGIILTLIAMFILLPYQGHGWGYRYLHGLIGSIALLGGYGWIALTERAKSEEAGACRTMLLVCSAFACFVLLPVHARQAHDFATPYATAFHAIEKAPADVVILDKSHLLFAEDLVRNDPFLRNRPKILELTNLSTANIAFLCAHERVAIFDVDQARAFGIAVDDRATVFNGDNTRAKLRLDLARLECGTGAVVKTDGTKPRD